MEPTLEQRLSVIVPVYNEENNVIHLYQELCDVLSKAHFLFEIIFVNDASSDNTLHQLQQLKAKDDTLVIINHKINYGQSLALCSGVKAASYATIAVLDGDGQNDPADIPRLFSLKQDAQTIVLGNRHKRKDNFLRKCSSLIGNTVRNTLLKDNCPDTGCSLKIFAKEAFLSLPQFNHMHRFLPALFQKYGYKTINVTVNHRPRMAGVSKYSVKNRLWVGIYDLIGICWLLKRSCVVELQQNE